MEPLSNLIELISKPTSFAPNLEVLKSKGGH
jgi:hypothetical protein